MGKSVSVQDFDMKDMGEASYVIGIKINKEESLLGLSQETYIIKVLKRFKMTIVPLTLLLLKMEISSFYCRKLDVCIGLHEV